MIDGSGAKLRTTERRRRSRNRRGLDLVAPRASIPPQAKFGPEIERAVQVIIIRDYVHVSTRATSNQESLCLFIMPSLLAQQLKAQETLFPEKGPGTVLGQAPT